MSPIQYLEATCDRCSKAIDNALDDAEFGILRNGQLVCATCRDQRPDHEHFKNFSIAKHTYNDDDEPEDEPEKYYCTKCKRNHLRERSVIGLEHADFEGEEPKVDPTAAEVMKDLEDLEESEDRTVVPSDINTELIY